ncbi:hypothetical protein DND132_1627 [Pseudodesulfovibrio mercurii]|uniref:Uncharacterized protein n=1 Tax=Pseudodesulfovibrio mercurii TaxID=641491 RepID=F0JF33_9BACT|nr:hypothetical protein DND132_1627 [Pseudodesulfovibrio mercurii]
MIIELEKTYRDQLNIRVFFRHIFWNINRLGLLN